MLRYLTAGESHGPQVTAVLEGLPAGIPITREGIDEELKRRQGGYGRGGRMKIETDKVEVVSGMRFGRTLGGPVTMVVKNKDWDNWRAEMDPFEGPPEKHKPFTRPRPGHADLVGGLKYAHEDLRNVLERASARETTARVAVGAICKQLLAQFGIRFLSYVKEIGGVTVKDGNLSFEEKADLSDRSDLHVFDAEAEARMKTKIDEARKKGETLGGVFEVVGLGIPPGLGTYVQWDRKLDGRLARGMMSIQAIKGVEVGTGFECARLFGSEAHDEIFYEPDSKWGFYRKTNRAGGLEGGMTTGDALVVRAAMKPLSTLMKPLQSVDIRSKESFAAQVERSDVCAVPAAGVVGEAVVAFEICDTFLEKFGGDSIEEVRRNYEGYVAQLRAYSKPSPPPSPFQGEGVPSPRRGEG